jgi:signal transduction histidine kinase/ActR/RegA family two-component response regulator
MKVWFYLFIAIFFISIETFPQSGSVAIRIDSLENALKKVDPSQQTLIMQQIIDLAGPISPKLAHSYAVKVLNSSGKDEKIVFARYKAANFLIGYFESRQLYDSAQIAIKQAAISIEDYKKMREKSDSENFKQMISNAESKPGKRSNGIVPLIFVSVLSVILLIISFIFFKNRKQISQQQLIVNDLKLQNDLIKKQLSENEAKVESAVNQQTAKLQEQLDVTRAKELELKKTLKKAEDANYLKNAFLGIISHEIRTPLNGIIGFSSLLETELSLLENKELYEFAEGIQQSGDRLLNLLNNIIDISKLEANDIDIDLHPCKIDEIVNNIFELFVFVANEKGLAFRSKLSEVPQVIADNAKLMRVIHIIVDNAIKYTQSGFVNITCSFVPDSNEVLVRVKDTGTGIEANYQKHLFEAFRQESSGMSRSYQGAGLGLPLAKRLLDLMHGRIEINSMQNVGTTVDIYIPCERTISGNFEPVIETEALAPQIGKLDIFIVEDDRMNRMVLQKILHKSGQVTMAVDGDETMKIVSERYKKGHLFQVMLFDINLPSPWDGIKLLHTIRAEYKEYRYIPFIAQTAYAMAGDREKMLDAGFDDYLAKPINKNELMTIIVNQLEKFKGIKG